MTWLPSCRAALLLFGWLGFWKDEAPRFFSSHPTFNLWYTLLLSTLLPVWFQLLCDSDSSQYGAADAPLQRVLDEMSTPQAPVSQKEQLVGEIASLPAIQLADGFAKPEL